jgi:hypothetical protein
MTKVKQKFFNRAEAPDRTTFGGQGAGEAK